MLTWDSNALAAAASGVRGACWLIEANFLSGVQRMTNWPTDVTDPGSGNTFTRAGNALSLAVMNESEDNSPGKLVISISVADGAILAKAIGAASEYRNRSIRAFLQLMTATGVPTGAAKQRYYGYMESTSIERAQPDTRTGKAGGSGVIKITCTKPGLSRSRHDDGLRLTHAQQQIAYPGDNGYEYVPNLIEKPQPWLSVRFQAWEPPKG